MLNLISHWLAFTIFKHQIFTDVTWLLPKLNFKGPIPWFLFACAFYWSQLRASLMKTNLLSVAIFQPFCAFHLLPWFTTVLWGLLIQIVTNGSLAWFHAAVLHLKQLWLPSCNDLAHHYLSLPRVNKYVQNAHCAHMHPGQRERKREDTVVCLRSLRNVWKCSWYVAWWGWARYLVLRTAWFPGTDYRKAIGVAFAEYTFCRKLIRLLFLTSGKGRIQPNPYSIRYGNIF